MYRYVLIDNDNTLMDFSAAEHAAIRETLSGAGLPCDDAACALYAGINDALWKALERGEVTQDILRVKRFAQFLEAVNRDSITPEALCDLYEHHLGCHAELIDGAEALLRSLKNAGCKIALVSNGISVIQRSRLSHCPFMPYLDAVFISGEETVRKPNPAVVDLVLERLGCTDKTDAILLGDSTTADIACAAAAGIDSLLFSPAGKTDPRSIGTAHTLQEAAEMLLSPVTYRIATPADGPACAAIQRPYIEKTCINFLYKPLTEEEFTQKIASLLPRYPFIVAEENGQVVGFAYASELRPHDAYDWDVETSIYMAENRRHRGLGRGLYQRLIALCERMGFLNLYGCVTHPNPASDALHQALGFQHVGYFPHSGFKQGQWLGVTWFCRMPEKYPETPAPTLPITAIETEDILS